MKVRIRLDLDPIYTDDLDSTGLTEPAYEDLTRTLARFGDIIDIEKDDDE